MFVGCKRFLLFLIFLGIGLASQESYVISLENKIDAVEIHSRNHSEFWNGDVSAYDFSQFIQIAAIPDSIFIEDRIFNDSSIQWLKYEDINLLERNDHTYWIKFSLRNNLDDDLSAYLLFNAWRTIDLFELDDKKQLIRVKQSGNYLPLDERDVKMRRIPFINTSIHSNETKYYAVKLTRGGDEFWFDNSNENISGLIFDESDILNEESFLRLIIGFSVGLIITMILFNFFLFFITKNIGSLYNGLFLLSFEFFYLTTYGIAFELIWPNFVFFDFHAHSIFIVFTIIALNQFLQHTLDLKNTFKNFDRFYQILSISTISILITQFMDLRNWNELFINLIFTAAFFTGVIITFKAWRSGNKAAKYYFYGIAYMHLIQIFIGLSQNGILPYFYGSFTNFDFAQFAACVQMALYSYGLVISYKESQDDMGIIENEKEIAEIKAASYKEIEENKSKFFSTVSHEFRTPLTLILGAIENIKEKSAVITQPVNTISENSKRLLRLINQLLDFSKIEQNGMTVNIRKYDLVSYMKILISNFKSAASEKNIKLKFESKESKLYCDLDFIKIEKIVLNLVSNAIKFTKKGSITIYLEKKDSTIEIRVEDTGIGISSVHRVNVFNRFYQVNQESHREYEGTGIGLALCKELIQLHNGTISIESELEIGTKLKIQLPYNNETSTALFEIKDYDIRQELEKSTLTIDQSETDSIHHENLLSDKTILVIEDNKEMRNYIKEMLEENYNVLEAHNGIKGLEIAKEQIPDFILTDIMMPKMDGIELLSELKKHFETRHIPVIIISGKADEKGKTEGMASGAIDYLTKPFDKKQLMNKIASILAQFELFRDRIMKSMNVLDDVQQINNSDEQFLIDLKQFILTHLKDADSKLISDHFALSESTLFRKIKALTAYGINAFIKKVKLDISKQLIKENGQSISEISSKCGFKSSSHFTKSFKEQFGELPSDV